MCCASFIRVILHVVAHVMSCHVGRVVVAFMCWQRWNIQLLDPIATYIWRSDVRDDAWRFICCDWSFMFWFVVWIFFVICPHLSCRFQWQYTLRAGPDDNAASSWPHKQQSGKHINTPPSLFLFNYMSISLSHFCLLVRKVEAIIHWLITTPFFTFHHRWMACQLVTCRDPCVCGFMCLPRRYWTWNAEFSTFRLIKHISTLLSM